MVNGDYIPRGFTGLGIESDQPAIQRAEIDLAVVDCDSSIDNVAANGPGDISIVVIKGAYLYKDEAGEKRVGPGGFLFVPGGHKHWSGGDKTAGALFYEEGSGKFDSIAVK